MRRDPPPRALGAHPAAVPPCARTSRVRSRAPPARRGSTGHGRGLAHRRPDALGIGLAEGELERRGEAASADRAHNYEAALFAQATAEIREWAALMGGRAETPLWLPGVGDMYVTGTGGRNVRVGHLLGFPLMRHLYELVALERPLNIPRSFGGQPIPSAR